MKIAILYSGAIRTLAETIENNLKCFQYADIDLYFSIWDHVGYSDRINSPDHIFSKREIEKSTLITQDLVRSLVPSKINIKNIKIEKYEPIKYNFNLINSLDNSGLSAQYYKILDCFNLLDDNINYDAIIRSRCDIVLNNNIDQQYLEKMLHDDKIIFPSKIWYDHSWDTNKRALNEMFWIATKDLMKKTCNIYINSHKINKVITAHSSKELNYGEGINFMNLEAENLLKNISTFDFDYQILR